MCPTLVSWPQHEMPLGRTKKLRKCDQRCSGAEMFVFRVDNDAGRWSRLSGRKSGSETEDEL